MEGNAWKAYRRLVSNIVRSFTAAWIGLIGRDQLHGEAVYAAQRGIGIHMAIPNIPLSLALAVAELSQAAGGALGSFQLGDTEGAMIRVRQLATAWEEEIERAILVELVIGLSTALEAFVDEMRGQQGTKDFIERNAGKGADALKEFRETRNCLIHNLGQVDDAYVKKSGSAARAQTGEQLPLDWAYIDDRLGRIMAFAKDVVRTPYSPTHKQE